MSRKSPSLPNYEICTNCEIDENGLCDFHEIERAKEYNLKRAFDKIREQTIAENDKIWFERLKEHEPKWVKAGFEKALAQVEKIINYHTKECISLPNWCRDEMLKEIKNLKDNSQSADVAIKTEISPAVDTHSKQFRYPKGHNWEGMTPEEVNQGYKSQEVGK